MPVMRSLVRSLLRSLVRPRVWARPCSTYSNAQDTHFGYQAVSEEQKKEKVLGVFHNVADSYDVMNDAMSLGVHRLWKDHFMAKLHPTPEMRLLDVAGGTGDIAFRFLEFPLPAHTPADHRQVACCDINASMLAVGRARSLKLGLDPQKLGWVEGDAQQLPFEDNAFDAYTIAFGIRNVVRIEEALSEAFRVLKPGGRFMCLEFSHVDNPVIGPLYDLYSFQVIPPMGQILAGDWDSYQYLVESIRQFPDQATFKAMIRGAGFSGVTFENLTLGVAAIHSGFKMV